MKRTIAFVLLASMCPVACLWAEDWTTSDGKAYANVTVIKVEADAVTILDRDGGALIPLSKLPVVLQVKFHYDPARATAAAKTRAQTDAKDATALQAERIEAQKKALVEAVKARTPAAKTGASTDAVDFSKIDQNQVGDDATHHRDLEYPLKHSQ